MANKKGLVSFTLQLPKEVNAAIKREAGRQYISKGQLIRELVKKEYGRIARKEKTQETEEF